MIVPTKIKVLGMDIEIKTVTSDYLKARDSEEGEGSCQAYYSSTKQTIYISEELTDENLRRTLMHELFHAFLCVSGQSNYLKEEQEEALCDLVENYVDLFRQPQLMEMMLEGGLVYEEEDEQEDDGDDNDINSDTTSIDL